MMKLKSTLIALSMFMVAGAFLSKSAHAECREGEERTTTTEAVFTCDTSHASLGEAWRDPNGLIWGEVVTKADGTAHRMNHYDATNHCASIGARLPLKDEFTRLREYMGAQPGTPRGYSAQVLPNLSGWFWSLSVDPDDAGTAFGFDGWGGDIYNKYRGFNSTFFCVISR